MPKIIKVRANPFAGGIRALDGDGQAHQAVQMINDDGLAMPGMYVGAELDHKGTAAAERHLFFHTEKVVTLHVEKPLAFAYYRTLIHEGHLVCADRASAKIMGIAFLDPDAYIDACKAEAEREFEAEHGRAPACADGLPQKPEPTDEKEEVAAKLPHPPHPKGMLGTFEPPKAGAKTIDPNGTQSTEVT